jgi:multifunctional beta-oxidation protein
MGLDFKDLVCVITGGGGALGRSYALMYGRGGGKVVINDVSKEAAEKVAAEVRQVGGQAIVAVGSVMDGQKIIDEAVKAFGTVHVLINNAGVLRDKSFRNMTQKEFDDVYDIHVRGAYYMTKAVWPIFRGQKFGRIVNTSSPAGIYGNGGQTNYSGAKMGLVTFAQVWNAEGVKYNIKANTIAPLAASNMTATVMTPEVLSHLSPDHIAPLVGVLTARNGPDVGGRLFEVGAGFYGEVKWQQSEGHVFKADDSFTPNAVDLAWPKVKDFSKGVTFPNKSDGPKMMEIVKLQPTLKPNPQGPSTPASFKGYTVIITGAGAGLGAAYARYFAKYGANVVVNDINAEAANKVVEEVNRLGGVGLAAVGSVEEPEPIVKATVDKFGTVHALINNAGILRDKAFINTTPELFDSVLNIHVRGSWKMAKAVWPYMYKQQFGRILNTSSPNGVTGVHGQANYGTAKAAVIGFTRALAIEGRKNNIYVNAMCPSAGTAMTATVWTQELLDTFKPDFVAPISAYLASPLCHDNGLIIKAFGGLASQYRWMRTGGLTFPNDRPATPDQLAAKWAQVEKIDGNAIFPENAAQARAPITANFNNQKGARL